MPNRMFGEGSFLDGLRSYSPAWAGRQATTQVASPVQSEDLPTGQPTPFTGPATGPTMRASTNEIVVRFPTTIQEASEVAGHLKARQAILVNLQQADRDSAQRIIDFLGGVTFAVDGHIEQVGKQMILCTPKTIGINTGATRQVPSYQQVSGMGTPVLSTSPGAPFGSSPAGSFVTNPGTL
jgi:hypothetical protein